MRHFPDVKFVLDKTIDCQSCHSKRPDAFIDCYTHCIIIIEIDENQHKGYFCETKRMMTVFDSLGRRNCVFIRFNPDSYNNSHGIFGFTVCGTIRSIDGYNERLKKLHDTLRYHLDNIPQQEITIDYLFYNEN